MRRPAAVDVGLRGRREGGTRRTGRSVGGGRASVSAALVGWKPRPYSLQTPKTQLDAWPPGGLCVKEPTAYLRAATGNAGERHSGMDELCKLELRGRLPYLAARPEGVATRADRRL